MPQLAPHTSVRSSNLLTDGRRCSMGVAAVALGMLLACGGERKFEVKSTLQVDSTGRTLAHEMPFDLLQVPEIASVKDRVTSVRLDSADATIVSLGAQNQATTMSCSLTLRAAGANPNGSDDLGIGTLTAPLIQGIPAGLPGSTAIDAFLLKVTQQNNGRFSFLFAGTTDREPHFTIAISLHGAVSP